MSDVARSAGMFLLVIGLGLNAYAIWCVSRDMLRLNEVQDKITKMHQARIEDLHKRLRKVEEAE